MYFVFYPVLRLHVKGNLSYNNKAKNMMKNYISDHSQYCFGVMLHFRVYSIDLDFNMVNSEGHVSLHVDKRGGMRLFDKIKIWHYSGNKIN